MSEKENNSKSSDGFGFLLAFHRLSGSLYLGYNRKESKLHKACLLIWALCVWSYVLISNAPCLIECHLSEFKHMDKTHFYLFNSIFFMFSISNIFCAAVYTMRGQRFYHLITKLNGMVANRTAFKKLRIMICVYLVYLFTQIIGRTAGNWKWTYIHAVFALEDLFSAIMAEQTGFLLIYLSQYISIIIDELNEKIKNSLKSKENDFDFNELFESISRIQKYIKLANNLLNPCLLIVFVLNMFFLISFGFLLQSLAKETDQTPIFAWPLLAIFFLRIFVWCLFVDRMNQKNRKTFDLILSKNWPQFEDKLNPILGLQPIQQTFDASNFFNINKSLFLSVIGISISYTLLFIQNVH